MRVLVTNPGALIFEPWPDGTILVTAPASSNKTCQELLMLIRQEDAERLYSRMQQLPGYWILLDEEFTITGLSFTDDSGI